MYPLKYILVKISLLKISREKRESKNGHKGAVFWLTGFSGAGKSTVAKALEQKLFTENYQKQYII